MNRFVAIFLLLINTHVYAQILQAEATCPGGVPETAGDSEIELRPNGEVLHVGSNLIFMRCSIGQTWDGAMCNNEPTAYNWQQALNISQTIEYNDARNWRLPNIKELALIVERACVRPSVDDTFFPNTSPDDYWTSTPSLLDEAGAWTIAFTNGSNSVKLKSRSLFVRLVRTRLPGDTATGE